jgi:putative nucleotidyltransferase with HDIG domain
VKGATLPTETAQRRLNNILQKIEHLRPMPGSVSRVLSALEIPDVSSGHIAELLGLDQALSALVLRFANSAVMGYDADCSNLSDAVMRLGFKRIKTLILGAATSDSLNQSLAGYRIGYGALWNHSVATATMAEWLCRALNYPDPEEGYVAGLLHDMGKLFLDQYVRVDYSRIIAKMNNSSILLWQVEVELFGIDHAGVGGLMAQKWRFPEKLVEAIRCHHTPSLAFEQPKLAATINIANAFATRDEIGLTDPHGDIVHPEALSILNITDKQLERLKTDMSDYFKVGQSFVNGKK